MRTSKRLCPTFPKYTRLWSSVAFSSPTCQPRLVPRVKDKDRDKDSQSQCKQLSLYPPLLTASLTAKAVNLAKSLPSLKSSSTT